MPSIAAGPSSAAARLLPSRYGAREVSAVPDDPRVPNVLLVDVEPALAAMVAEWLEPCGWRVRATSSTDAGQHPADLLIVDVPFPRQERIARQRFGATHALTPILLISSTFFAGVACNGTLARQLDVAGVLAKPLQHDCLVAAVEQALRPMARPS
jgi:DNA-binding response OmpR family regulator